LLIYSGGLDSLKYR